jgi:hypothetical protein
LLALGGWTTGLFVVAMMEKAEIYSVARCTPDGWKLVRISRQPPPRFGAVPANRLGTWRRVSRLYWVLAPSL